MKAILALCFTLNFIVGLEYLDPKSNSICILLWFAWLRLPRCFSNVAQRVLALRGPTNSCFPLKSYTGSVLLLIWVNFCS